MILLVNLLKVLKKLCFLPIRLSKLNKSFKIVFNSSKNVHHTLLRVLCKQFYEMPPRRIRTHTNRVCACHCQNFGTRLIQIWPCLKIVLPWPVYLQSVQPSIWSLAWYPTPWPRLIKSNHKPSCWLSNYMQFIKTFWEWEIIWIYFRRYNRIRFAI